MHAFIVFEGIDCCGKSTQIQHLKKRLENDGISVLATREPGGTPLAEKIRTLILEESLDPMTELLLLSAARHEHVQKVISPALQQGKITICDRFYGSTLAYQCYGKGLDPQIAMQVTNIAIGPVRPTLTILLDIMPEVAQARKANRAGDDNNHYDDKGLTFYTTLRAAFVEIAKTEENWSVVNADQNEDFLANEVYEVVRKRLHLNNMEVL
ncbi:MAG: dTMP kinase [Proteobacteria bacterium]|nr:dTMP kinase [Pseudomonadota bacterium]